MRLGTSSWEYRPTSIVFTSPVIDDEGNVYFTETSGRIVSLTKFGVARWSVGEVEAGCRHAGNPALHGDYLYDYCDSGWAFSLRLADGKVRWRKKIAVAAPWDAATVVVYGDVVIMPVSLKAAINAGNCDFVALDLEDGAVRWSYSVCERARVPSVNALPAVVDGMVIAHDITGGMHAFSVEDGTPRWYHAGYAKGTASTGASAAGPNNMVYAGFVREGVAEDGKGMVRAHDIFTGQVAWARHFPRGINAGVAVGRLRGDSELAVVALVADNFTPQMSGWQTAVLMGSWAPKSWKQAVKSLYRFEGQVVALDAQTGTIIWTFDLDAQTEWGYNGLDRGCFPDAAGTPSIGADGTVYVNWSKGISYALRDVNGDGFINTRDAKEFSKLEHGNGCNGQTAIAPGLVVAPSCDSIFGWLHRDAHKAE